MKGDVLSTEDGMLDLYFLLLAAVCFVLLAGYIGACASLGRHDNTDGGRA